MRIGLPSQIFNPCTDQDRSLAHPLSTNGRDHPAYGRASPTAAAVCAAPVTRAAQKRGKGFGSRPVVPHTGHTQRRGPRGALARSTTTPRRAAPTLPAHAFLFLQATETFSNPPRSPSCPPPAPLALAHLRGSPVLPRPPPLDASSPPSLVYRTTGSAGSPAISAQVQRANQKLQFASSSSSPSAQISLRARGCDGVFLGGSPR